MKKFLFLIAIFCALKTNAQNYLITFAGTGVSTTVNSVKVENLTAGTSLTLNGSDILRLMIITTNINSIENNQSSELKIYPNPMTDNSVLQIYPSEEGNAVISVHDLAGKLIAQIQSYLENNLQEFRISGIKSGFYLISVKGSNYQYSGKLLCNSKAAGTISIEKITNNQIVAEKISKTDYKGTQATVDMAYTSGDRIKFTGISGNYSTVKTDIPAGDKTITFDFIACTDGDNNNYPVVAIGTQVWMAENLKTTKYSDGDLIGTTTPATLNISGESTPKYQWTYEGNESNVATYGRLYTWYAVTDNRNICPTGWHVPTDVEMSILTLYLTNNDYGFEGSGNDIGKSMATTFGWITNPTPGCIGNDQASNNSSGFTGPPGGIVESGSFGGVGIIGDWWLATEQSAISAFNLLLECNYWGKSIFINRKHQGFSVRCLRGDGVPIVTTTAPASITQTTATSGGNVISDGGGAITARGVCWGTLADPTIANSKTTDGSGIGSFISSITGLSVNSTYYLRAYAINSYGISYGNQISFTTSQPVLTTTAVSSITRNTAISGGNVTSEGGAIVTVRGVCWGTLANPTIANSKTTDGTGTGSFISSITGLSVSTPYYLRAYATNSIGTSYGNEIAFTTEPITAPVLTTTTVSSITENTAISGGNVTNDGGAPVTAFGVCWSSLANPTIVDTKTTDGSGTGTFTSSITGLTPYTTYYIRAYAINSVGTTYGNEITFTTNPTITTKAVTLITQTTATSGGNITSDGGAYITARGVCWGTTTNPTIADSHTSDGTGTGTFSSALTGLSTNTKYYLRAYVTNSVGIAYGNEIFFATKGESGTVSDIDGNTYPTIEIGTQTWMAENLKTTRFRNGDLIGTTTPTDKNISGESFPKYQWAYEGNEVNITEYGRLYTWYTVNDSRNICPTGWHVSTDEEWHTLVLYLDGSAVLSSPESNIAGGKLKETGTVHWTSPNQGATNESGFTARAGGFRASIGVYLFQKGDGYWWSSTESSTIRAWSRWISSMGPGDKSISLIDRKDEDKMYGMAVRCVME